MNDKEDKQDISNVMQCLGRIEGRLNELSTHSSRQTFALIGVIAAQIGVKVLGTDPMLDIATALSLIGAVLLIGCLAFAFRRIKYNHQKLTTTGWWLTVFVILATITQIGVYFRDLGFVNAQIIYAIRIVQNFTIIGFAWALMGQGRLWQQNEKKEDSLGCSSVK